LLPLKKKKKQPRVEEIIPANTVVWGREYLKD
jgi:hypothetical protein